MRIRNLHEAATQASEIAEAPRHMKKPIPVFNMYDESRKIIDPFDYLWTGMTKEEEENF